MTFDEWWAAFDPDWDDLKGNSRQAWAAAVAAERERCARYIAAVAEEHRHWADSRTIESDQSMNALSVLRAAAQMLDNIADAIRQGK